MAHARSQRPPAATSLMPAITEQVELWHLTLAVPQAHVSRRQVTSSNSASRASTYRLRIRICLPLPATWVDADPLSYVDLARPATASSTVSRVDSATPSAVPELR